MPKRRAISPSNPVWQYFIVNCEENTKVDCLLCNAQVTRGRMKKHLQVNHKETSDLLQELHPDCSKQPNINNEECVIWENNDQQAVTPSNVLDHDDSMDEFDEFCKNLAQKIRHIYTLSPKLAAELQYKIHEEIFLKEIQIYS